MFGATGMSQSFSCCRTDTGGDVSSGNWREACAPLFGRPSAALDVLRAPSLSGAGLLCLDGNTSGAAVSRHCACSQTVNCSVVCKGRRFHSSSFSAFAPWRFVAYDDASGSRASLNRTESSCWSTLRVAESAASVSASRFSRAVMYAAGRPRLPPS